MNVRIGQLVLETVRALWSRPWWAILVVLTSVAVGAGTAAVVAADSHALEQRSERLAQQGWGLIALSSASGQPLDAQACRAAAQVDGVTSSGAVGRAHETSALGLSAGLSLTAIDAAVIDIVWPGANVDPTKPGVLTPGFTKLSGLDAGTLYVGADGPLVALPSDAIHSPGRYPPLDGGVLLSRGELVDADYCLVEVPGEQAESLALDIAAATVSYSAIAVPVLSGEKARPTPHELVVDHRARQFPLLAAAFLAVVGALRLIRSRRDRAVYRLLSLGRADLWMMGFVDFAVCLAVPALSAFATVVVVADQQGTPTAALGRQDFALLTASIAVVGVLYASLCALGRNRHQFAPGT